MPRTIASNALSAAIRSPGVDETCQPRPSRPYVMTKHARNRSESRSSADARKWVVLELIQRALTTKRGPQDDLGRTVVDLADQRSTRCDRAKSFQCFLCGLRRDDCDESALARQIQRIETQQFTHRLHGIIDR